MSKNIDELIENLPAPSPESIEIAKNFNSRLQAFSKYYPSDSDDVLVKIIKAHLLIENLIHQYIENSVISYKYIKDSRISFNIALNFARSLCKNERDEWIWDACKKLNIIRNAFSHNLEIINELDDEITDLQNYIMQNRKVVNNPFDYESELDLSLFYLYDNFMLALTGTDKERELLKSFLVSISSEVSSD